MTDWYNDPPDHPEPPEWYALIQEAMEAGPSPAILEALRKMLDDWDEEQNRMHAEPDPPAATPTGWQPIETAPFDAVVVAYHRDIGRFFAVWDFAEGETTDPGWWVLTNPEDIDDGLSCETPTHWMPLPPPPDCGAS